jgi:ribose transport system substrate-binding protein
MNWRQILATCAALAMTAGIASGQEGIDNANRNAYLKSLAGKRVIYIPLELRDNAAAWYKALRQQAGQLGYTVDVRDPNWNTEVGARALSTAISEKADLVVLQNPDVQSYAKLIKKAQDAGIKVIQINMESLTQSDTYVGADWVGIGYVGGSEIAKRCSGHNGPSNKVAIVTGVPTSSIDLYQMYGFHKAIKELAPDIQIVSQQAAGYDATKAHGIMSSVLQRNPDLCATFGVWDGQDAGVAAAVKEAGKSNQVFVVTSGGGNQTSCEKVKDGLFSLFIEYDARMQGAALNVQVAELLQSKANAGANPVVYYGPNYLVTKANLTPESCWTAESMR